MRLTFLDFDGVMNSVTSTVAHEPRTLDHLCPTLVQLMERFVAVTKSQVVVSSTWRECHTIEKLKELLAEAGWVNAPIIAVTPILHGKMRGDEVNLFMDTFEHSGEVESYVIFDDDSDFYPDQPLVHTDLVTGFTLQNFVDGLRILDPENDMIKDLKGYIK